LLDLQISLDARVVQFAEVYGEWNAVDLNTPAAAIE